ncbi:hypothetical protein PCYB_141970 [Plasmodium cynomolgi strain B]|uniref:CYIR protein n=1 Tax=Plasmodium cynomolgi (strain B) TaxID=1120755 RepID=K6UY50_PLACD|nr:hypothetical protein PCYB_141970 [Plasmodium cynomolgi strain B]GAB68769.1 hypothetical protein PCYB_141970 [Plasmodium cynomolgi strain B]
MKKYLVLLCLLIFTAGRLSVKAIRKKDLRRSLKGGNRNNEDRQKKKNLLNFEIMQDKSSVSNIELNSSTLFNILASTRLMQNSGGATSQTPIYRYVHNIHDHNENNGAVLVFVLFGILIFAVLFFIFYFIFRHHVKHIKFMNSM